MLKQRSRGKIFLAGIWILAVLFIHTKELVIFALVSGMSDRLQISIFSLYVRVLWLIWPNISSSLSRMAQNLPLFSRFIYCPVSLHFTHSQLFCQFSVFFDYFCIFLFVFFFCASLSLEIKRLITCRNDRKWVNDFLFHQSLRDSEHVNTQPEIASGQGENRLEDNRTAVHPFCSPLPGSVDVDRRSWSQWNFRLAYKPNSVTCSQQTCLV